MIENSYLNSAAIKAQCMEAIKKLQKDNIASYTVEKSLSAFIDNTEIISSGFNSLKQQMKDYKTVLQTIRMANQADMDDFLLLYYKVGDQELNGAIILSEKENARKAKISDEKNAEKYRNKLRGATTISLRTYYTSKVTGYQSMAELDQRLYNAWQEKENRYNEIEKHTSGLFTDSEPMRIAVRNAIEGIKGAFQNGTYVPDMQASWRGEIEGIYQEQLSKIGYTQEEIDALEVKGVNLTYVDIINLKSTIGTEKIIRSEDANALLYQGKVYYINVPKVEECYDAYWNVDQTKTFTNTDFNWAAGILGINLEDISKEELFDNSGRYKLQSSAISGKDKNATTAAALNIFMGIGNFLISGLEHTEVILSFESNGNYRRVTIGAGDSQTRLKMQGINYNIPVNTYGDGNNVGEYNFASDYAAGIYKVITGENVPDEDGIYTITGTLDERHKEDRINGYLSYSETGELLYTPLVYSGDTAYVATCQKFTGLNTEEILEFTEWLPNPVPANKKVQEILEKAMEGENSEE